MSEATGSTHDGDTAVLTTPAPTRVRRLPRWQVLLHNDDVNEMVYVIQTIVDLTHLDRHDAAVCMLEAHSRGLSRIEST